MSQTLPQPFTRSCSRARAGAWLLERSLDEGYSSPAVPSSPPVPLLLENLFLSALPKAQHELSVLGCFWVTQFSAGVKTDTAESPGNSHSQNDFSSVFFTQKRDYLNLWKMIAGERRAAQSKGRAHRDSGPVDLSELLDFHTFSCIFSLCHRSETPLSITA